MSVLVEAINIIVRKETLKKKYPGGVAAYERNCPNKTYCADDHLTRIGFLSPSKAQSFMEGLAALGLVFYDGEKFVDVAVLDQTMGLTAPCEWLTIGKLSEGFTRCWFAGTEDEQTIFPAGRTPESIRAANLFLLPEEDSQSFEFSRDGGEPFVLCGQVSYAARVPNHPVLPCNENICQAIG